MPFHKLSQDTANTELYTVLLKGFILGSLLPHFQRDIYHLLNPLLNERTRDWSMPTLVSPNVHTSLLSPL